MQPQVKKASHDRPERAPLLEALNLRKIFGGGLVKKQRTVALDDFSLVVPDDEPRIVAVAGESGSGKTTLAGLLLGFLTPTSGEILWRGRNMRDMSGGERKVLRRELQAVFQNPYDVFNPFYRVNHSLKVAVSKFKMARSRSESKEMIAEALRVVGLRPEEIEHRYPHELSGGQRQRVMLARAFLLKPRLIVADEPVSMVDASIRAMILDIMMRLKDESGISFLYITHDLSTAYQISDRIFILYGGATVESGDASTVIRHPMHPYSRLLIGSIPIPNPSVGWAGGGEYVSETGNGGENGCRFCNRCPEIMKICRDEPPPVCALGGDRKVACHLYSSSVDTAGQEPPKGGG